MSEDKIKEARKRIEAEIDEFIEVMGGVTGDWERGRVEGLSKALKIVKEVMLEK